MEGGTVAGSNGNQRQTRYTDFNPYAWGDGDESMLTTRKDEHDDLQVTQHLQGKHERRKFRKNTGRRRLDRQNQGNHKHQKRHVTLDDGYYYVQSADIVSNLHWGDMNQTNFQHQSAAHHHHHHSHRQLYGNKSPGRDATGDANNKLDRSSSSSSYNTKAENQIMDSNSIISNSNRRTVNGVSNGNGNFTNGYDAKTIDHKITGNRTRFMEHDESSETNGTNVLNRVKRKSGKTTGALSRPKGGSDSGSKSTSRKKDGKQIVCIHCNRIFSSPGPRRYANIFTVLGVGVRYMAYLIL